MTAKIIMAFGMPRSGTTWCGKIFDSHPDTMYRHEPDTSSPTRDLPLMAPVGEIDHYEQKIKDYVAGACHVRTERVSASLPMFPKKYYSPLSFQLRKGLILATKVLSRQWHNLTVPDFVDIDGNHDIKIVWKSIESLGRLGLFARVLGNSRAIHIIRHPCGQISSVVNGEAGGKFTEKSPSSEDYGILKHLTETEAAGKYRITLDKLKAMEPIERLAWRWVIFNEQAMIDTAALENCMLLRYEDLCLNPEAKTRELFAFTGLNWNDQTAEFIGKSTKNNNDRYYSVFKDPVKAMNKWQDSLPGERIDRITKIVKDTQPGELYFSN